MKSAMAANDGYIDESSLDFSASNGQMQSDNAYQIDELGDFRDFASDNQGIGSDQSMSFWTSGNGGMYSDNYGSSEFKWSIDQNVNEIDDETEWKQFNDLYQNGSSKNSSDSSNSSSSYDSSDYDSNTPYLYSDSDWSSDNSMSSFSSNSSFSSSISSTTSSCSSCSESYVNSALDADFK